MSFTSIAHARNWRREDSVPKTVFGKVSEQGGRRLMPVSVEAHHAHGRAPRRALPGAAQQLFLAPEEALKAT
ncbi:MAG: hypothetical protein ABUT39_25020 [Acidobacteriota bacterium]